MSNVPPTFFPTISLFSIITLKPTAVQLAREPQPTFPSLPGFPPSQLMFYQPTFHPTSLRTNNPISTNAPSRITVVPITDSMQASLSPSPAPTLTPSPAPSLTPSPAPSLSPSLTPSLSPSTTTLILKNSNNEASSNSQNAPNTTIIIAVIVVVFIIIAIVACVVLFKKPQVKQVDAYQKWNNYYESKEKNREHKEDIHHFYSKNRVVGPHVVTFPPTRLSMQNSRIPGKPISRETISSL